MTIRLTLIVAIAFGVLPLIAQLDSIAISNPSFEGEPKVGGFLEDGERRPASIKRWADCGPGQFPGQSPPDLLPHRYGWNVAHQPYDGNTFLSMVVREDGSFESLSQPLPVILKAGKCYRLSVALARSPHYLGNRDEGDGNEISFNKPFIEPAVFRIHGAKRMCDYYEQLVLSDPVKNEEWQVYEFEFSPESDIKYISIGPYFASASAGYYNGHVLIDQFSAITEVDCSAAGE